MIFSEYLDKLSSDFTVLIESDFMVVFAAFLCFSIVAFPVLFAYFSLFKERISSKRLTEIEHRIDNLECYFKFNPDGTLSKVSDLDIDCSAVDINKPTE